jgi:nicotinamide riboside kinase
MESGKKPIKIVLTGAESTGKTTLAKQLAGHLNEPLVIEKAREYLSGLNRPYAFGDLLKIAKLQFEEEEKTKRITNRFLICDTDLLTLYIWSMDKFNRIDHWISDTLFSSFADYYLLCYPDLPWEPDPLREDPDRLLEIHNKYENFLRENNLRFSILKGVGNGRWRCLVNDLHHLI